MSERTMTGPRAAIVRHAALSYFLLTFAISWGGALLAIGEAGGMAGTTPASDPRFPYVMLAMLAGPGVSAIVMTALTLAGRGESQRGPASSSY